MRKNGRLFVEAGGAPFRLYDPAQGPPIGATEVDFFEPREWELKGDPPETLSFRDRSPGPILFGNILLAPYNRAVVNVVLGQDRVTYTLDRVKRDGTH